MEPGSEPSRRWRRVVLGVLAVVFVAVVVLGVEVVVAAREPALVASFEPAEVDGVDGVAADAGPAAAPLRIVWLGDSTAAGLGASAPTTALPRQVAQRLGRAVQTTVLARSGARIADVLAEQVPAVDALPADRRPELILVSVGANDVTHLTGQGAFQRTYLGVLDRLPKDVPVITLGIPDMGANTRLAQPLRGLAAFRGDNLDAVLKGLARNNGTDYVNIADFTGPTIRQDPGRYLASDGWHPNDAGYGLWADQVAQVVRWRLFYVENPDAEKPQPPPPARLW